MKTKTKKRNRASQDTTLINLRALKKRVEVLEEKMRLLWDMNLWVQRLKQEGGYE